MNSWFKRLHLLVCAVVLTVMAVPKAEAAGSPGGFADVPQQHWGYATVHWAAEAGIVQGDGKGNFHPNAHVTEPEFLAMLLRAYQDQMEIPAPSRSEKWYSPYYKVAREVSWPVSLTVPETGAYSRGKVAFLIAHMAGQEPATTGKAIQYLLDKGLANGKTSSTVEGFKAADPLTRAEAVTFIKNVKDKLPVLPDYSIEDGLTLFGIALGDSEQSVLNRLGTPNRKDPSEFGFTWLIFNGDYAHYAQVGVLNGKTVALYSNAKGAWSSSAGIKDGITASALSGILKVSVKGDKTYQDAASNEKTYYYFDNHQNNQIDAILHMNGSIGTADSVDSTKLAQAYEKQIFDLTNVFRLKQGAALLTWDDLAAKSARNHSKDMHDRDFFNHTNPDGKSPFDRMKSLGIKYSWAAENIAAGFRNAFEAHNGWLNSEGHRKNLLNENMERLGVGVYGKYYTQNFYTPF